MRGVLRTLALVAIVLLVPAALYAQQAHDYGHRERRVRRRAAWRLSRGSELGAD